MWLHPNFVSLRWHSLLLLAVYLVVDKHLAVTVGDPVDLAIEWAQSLGEPDQRIPFIAAANDKR